MTGSGPVADLLAGKGLLSVERCDAQLRAAVAEPPLPGDGADQGRAGRVRHHLAAGDIGRTLDRATCWVA
jgi:hypothetical protein